MVVANQSKYLRDYADTPVWKNTSTMYFPEGELYWEQLLQDLEQAQNFIFLEYFKRRR